MFLLIQGLLLLLLVNADYTVSFRLTNPKDCTSTPFNLFFNHTATPCTDTNSLKSYLSQCRANPETPAIVCTPTIPSFYALLKQYHPASSFININHHNTYSPTKETTLESVHDPHNTCDSEVGYAFGYLTDYCLDTEHLITKFIVNNTRSIYQVFYQLDQKGCVGKITRDMKQRWHDVDECFNFAQAIYYEKKIYQGWFSGIKRTSGLLKIASFFIALVIALYFFGFRDLATKSFEFRGLRNSTYRRSSSSLLLNIN